MGASVSQNIINITNKVVSKISSKLIQDTKLTTDSSQIISVKNVDGDVYIVGNKMYQKATVNMSALMKALSSQSAQMALVLEISQEAKSVISGLNIGQYADAKNVLDEVIDVEMNLMSEIRQTCASMIAQRQSIIVERVKGSVYIQNNVMDQVAGLLGECVSNVVSASDEVANLKEKLDQSASSKAEGLSGWIIVAIIAVIIGLPVGGGVIGGYAVLKFIFPLIAVAGGGLLVAYMLWTTRDIEMKGFSNLIAQSSGCLGKMEGDSSTGYKTAALAANQCLQDKKCAAVDFKMLDIQGDTSTVVKPPETTFYSYVSDGCAKTIGQDNTRTLRVAIIYVSDKDPDTAPKLGEYKVGDAFINTKSSAIFTKDKVGWIYKKNLITKKFDSLVVSGDRPADSHPPSSSASYYLWYNVHEPITLTLYTYDFGKKMWVSQYTSPGPGLVPDVSDNINSSGFIVNNKKIWLLYTGVGAIVMGIIGSVFTFAMNKKSSSSSSKGAAATATKGTTAAATKGTTAAATKGATAATKPKA